ncbi:MAG: cytochrome oxidase subunit III [Chloroflexi bacterium]|nr:cytochrome oxidase subunit III [Chloroflexota bacterium]MCK4263257.1 cytochrome oxidase subunit III [Dehalococcoidia bacterium]
MFVNEQNRERKFHLLGWILFVVCAGFFIASHAKADNLVGLIGSVIFLFACVVFIIPLVTKRNRD